MNAFEKRQASVESFVRREDGRGAPSDNPAVEPLKPVEGADRTANEAEPASSAPGQSTSLLRSASLPAVIGGLAGATMAVVAVLAMTELRPPLDPRLPGLAQQVAGFQQSLYTLETAIRGAETDLVQALEADSALTARMDQQVAGFETAMADIARARQELRIETGPGSVVFGVSVVQLADAVASGRPFESEWVNLYALTEGHDELRDPLRRLMPVASAGVATMASLQAQLRATAAAAGTPVVDPDNLYIYGLNLVQSGLGVPVGNTTEQQVVGNLVTEVDRRVSEGDLPGALAAFANLTEEAAEPFAAWLAQARRRASADAVVAELGRVSRDALQARAKPGAG